ncbi:peptide-binding protein [Insulibacter thermoxylanivorax]|uniref:Peptide-binding protein n=1 Tax=Insulibacter thermoxylanivorax TaxID=2749268 RepID=A0A916QEX8_9BACL|nr:peptide-binding protein [Insulibacter thermoxylanivorax]GFR37122.1 peptide-binding protein [Insulibacter thermoxylanivorax]
MSKVKRSLLLVLCVFLLGGVLAACSSNNNGEQAAPSNNVSENNQNQDTEGPKDGGTLTLSTISDIVSLNPLFIQDTASSDAAHWVFAKLYDLNREGLVTAEPWSIAAEEPIISEDGTTYTVKLKDYAKWSDGTPITADDIIFTIETIMNPDTGSPAISTFDKIESINKISDYEIEFKLSQVYAPFIYSLVFEPVPKHVLGDVPVNELKAHQYGSNPEITVTSGPWVWKEWTQGQQHVFERNPDYWGEVKPKIQTVIYKIYADQNTEVQALLRGDVDLVTAIPVTMNEAVSKEEHIRMILEPGPQYEFLGFNFDESNFPNNFNPFESQKTRQAIAYALDRQGMIDNVLKGTGVLMNAPMLPGTWADPGARAKNYEYNPEKAKELLAEDGWVMNEKTGILEKDGNPFSFELQYNTGNSRREQVAQVIQNNLAQVGIEVKPRGIDFAAWVEQNLTPGKYQAILLAWSLTIPDPDSETIFSSKYFPPAGQNMGWYVNEELDQLWVDGYSTTDIDERAEIYGRIGEIISEDLPYVFMYRYGNAIGIGPRVHFDEADAPEPSLATGYFFHSINWWVE